MGNEQSASGGGGDGEGAAVEPCHHQQHPAATTSASVVNGDGGGHSCVAVVVGAEDSWTSHQQQHGGGGDLFVDKPAAARSHSATPARTPSLSASSSSRPTSSSSSANRSTVSSPFGTRSLRIRTHHQPPTRCASVMDNVGATASHQPRTNAAAAATFTQQQSNANNTSSSSSASSTAAAARSPRPSLVCRQRSAVTFSSSATAAAAAASSSSSSSAFGASSASGGANSSTYSSPTMTAASTTGGGGVSSSTGGATDTTSSSSSSSSSDKSPPLASLLGLSAYQQQQIVQSWPRIQQSGGHTAGAEIFRKLTSKCPPIKETFQKADIIERLTPRTRGYDIYKEHGRLLFEVFQTAVSALSDSAVEVSEMCRGYGARHLCLRGEGFQTRMWDDLAELLVEHVTRLDAVRRHREVMRAWTAVIMFLVEKMKEGYDLGLRKSSQPALASPFSQQRSFVSPTSSGATASPFCDDPDQPSVEPSDFATAVSRRAGSDRKLAASSSMRRDDHPEMEFDQVRRQRGGGASLAEDSREDK